MSALSYLCSRRYLNCPIPIVLRSKYVMSYEGNLCISTRLTNTLRILSRIVCVGIGMSP